MKSHLCALLISALSSTATFASSDNYDDGLSCAPEVYARVQQVQYDTGYNYLIFTVEGFRDRWMALSKSYGVDTAYGRAMVSLLLTAFVTGTKVHIVGCKDGAVQKVEMGNPTGSPTGQ